MTLLWARPVLLAMALSCHFGLAIDLPSLFKKKQLPPELLYAAYQPPASAKSSSACSCLHWKAQYALRNAKCGQGAELFSYTGGINTQKALPAFMRNMDDHFCNDAPGKPGSAFFPKQDHNMCIRMNQFNTAGDDSGSWCYVSGHCQLGSTFPVTNSSLRLKICQPGSDVHLSDLEPPTLFEMARKKGIDYKMMAQMAYKTAGTQWDSYSKLASLRQMTWTDNQWFGEKNGAIKVAWKDQLWHIYPDMLRHPICVEGCDKVGSQLKRPM